MNELILKYKADLLTIVGFSGVCHNCNSPIYYSGKISGVKYEEDELSFRFLFIDVLICPHCNGKMISSKVYKSSNVTKEFEETKKDTQ